VATFRLVSSDMVFGEPQSLTMTFVMLFINDVISETKVKVTSEMFKLQLIVFVTCSLF